jgi:hypothetical protein
MNRIMAPSAAPTEARHLQGKSRRARGSVSFGGSNGLVCLFLLVARSTATTGAWPPPPAHAQTRPPAVAGSMIGAHGSHFGTLRSCGFAGKDPQLLGPTPLGAQMEVSALEGAGSTATRGAWPSPANTAAASSAAELPGAG